jgi:hypothetical protein
MCKIKVEKTKTRTIIHCGFMMRKIEKEQNMSDREMFPLIFLCERSKWSGG